MEIVTLLTGLLSGLILGYLGHRYQISQGKVNVQRERLLGNIAKVEQFLSIILEREYKDFQIIQQMKNINEIEEAVEKVSKTLKKIDKDRDPFREKLAEDEKSYNAIRKHIKKLEKGNNHKELITYRKKLLGMKRELEKHQQHLTSQQQKFTEFAKILDTNGSKLEESREILETLKKELGILHKQVVVSDIDAICEIVDPSGQISKYFGELVSIGRNISKNPSDGISVDQGWKLRLKIRELLDKKIK